MSRPAARTSYNEHSPSRLAADGVSNSFAIWNLIAYAIFEVERNVPGPAYATVHFPLRIATAWHGGRPPRRSCARATKTGPTTNILPTGGLGAPRTMMLEKVSDPVASYGRSVQVTGMS